MGQTAQNWSRQRVSRIVVLTVTLGGLISGIPAPAGTGSESRPTDQYFQKSYAFAEKVLANPAESEGRKVDAIGVVGFYNLREFRTQLEKLMKEDPSPVVRRAAANKLEAWRQRDAEAAERERREAEARRQAAMTPEEREREREEGERRFALMIRDQILQKLQSEKEEDRREAIAGAGTWAKHLPETIPILHKLARTDSHPGVRLHALIALLRARPNDPETLALLRQCAEPGNPRMVRSMAGAALCERCDKRGLGVLIELLRTDDVRFQAFTMITLRGAAMKGDIGPPVSLLTKAEKPNAQLTEEEKQAIREGAAVWEKWWKEEGPTFVLPRARATQPSSQPTTGPGR